MDVPGKETAESCVCFFFCFFLQWSDIRHRHKYSTERHNRTNLRGFIRIPNKTMQNIQLKHNKFQKIASWEFCVLSKIIEKIIVYFYRAIKTVRCSVRGINICVNIYSTAASALRHYFYTDLRPDQTTHCQQCHLWLLCAPPWRLDIFFLFLLLFSSSGVNSTWDLGTEIHTLSPAAEAALELINQKSFHS